MSDTTLGPVEVVAIGFGTPRIPEEVRNAFVGVLDSDVVRLLDLVVVRREEDGALTVIEFEDVADDLGLGGTELDLIGLAAEEDIEELAVEMAPGTSAAMLVIEHTWARGFVDAARDAGGVVLGSERIPAEVVNEIVRLGSE